MNQTWCMQTFVIIACCLLSCKSQHVVFPVPVIFEYDYTSFCSLPDEAGQTVYTRAIYRGGGEYWGLIAGNGNCKDLEAYVLWPEFKNTKFRKLIQQVHKSRGRYYLLVDVVGKFEMGDTSGYGHLNSYKSLFTTEKIINIQRLKKQQK